MIHALGGDDLVFGQSGNDVIHGGAGNDTIFGDADNDTIYGDADNDTIYGGDGIDTIEGGVGNDTIDGGAGIDTVQGYDASYHVARSGGEWVVTNNTDTDSLTNVEKAVVEGQTIWLVDTAAELTYALANAVDGDIVQLAEGDLRGHLHQQRQCGDDPRRQSRDRRPCQPRRREHHQGPSGPERLR